MTTPSERTRNLVQAGALLKMLEADSSLPESVRREATRLLRHYPTVDDLEELARQNMICVNQSVLNRRVLTTDWEEDWCASFPLGPHNG